MAEFNVLLAVGDHAYKQNTKLGPKEQMITALPDIQTVDLEAGDEFFVLACDGIWNSKSNQQVVDFVRPRLMAKKLTLSQICEEVRSWNVFGFGGILIFYFPIRQLFDECLAPNTMGDGTGCDNMTAMIVRLDRFLPQFQEFADSTATASLAASAHPVKRPRNDNSTDEKGGDPGSDKRSE
jgi:protein phosphatase 1G